MRRRGFLKATVAAGLTLAAAVLGGPAVLRVLRSRRRADLGRLLLERFDYLTFEPGTVERFVSDVAAFRETQRLHPKGLPVYERFLMSTDFFQNGADETRIVAYVSFYPPYQTSCYNPLASSPDEPC